MVLKLIVIGIFLVSVVPAAELPLDCREKVKVLEARIALLTEQVQAVYGKYQELQVQAFNQSMNDAISGVSRKYELTRDSVITDRGLSDDCRIDVQKFVIVCPDDPGTDDPEADPPTRDEPARDEPAANPPASDQPTKEE